MKKKFIASFLALPLTVGLCFNPVSTNAAPLAEEPPSFVEINDGTHNWTYVSYETGSNVVTNTATTMLKDAIAVSAVYKVSKSIPDSVWKALFAYSSYKGITQIPDERNVWWTVQKYQEVLPSVIYIKYEIKMYSNSAKTDLITSYSEIKTIN